MTRKEAIEILEFEKQGVFKSLATKKALDMAISALKQFDGMSNKEAIKELFPSIELGEIHNGRHRYFLKGKEIETFDLKAGVEWLNAPYKKGGE